MSDELVLSQAELNSALWRKIKRYLEARRDLKRRQNDEHKLDDRDTARLRGRIAELNELIALDDPAPGVEA